MPLMHRETRRAYWRVRQRLILTAAWEQELPSFPAALSQVVVQCLACDLGQFEADGPAGFPLAVSCSVDRVPIGRHIIHTERHKVATTQLAVDRKTSQPAMAGASSLISRPRSGGQNSRLIFYQTRTKFALAPA